MALKTMLEAMNQHQKAYREARDAISQEMIAKALGEAVPEGYILVWAQYTLYFNDGDACHFRVREPILVNAEDVKYLSDITSPWADDSGEWPDEMSKAWSEAASDNDLMENTFGDHKLIRVRRGGEFLVTDYTSHD